MTCSAMLTGATTAAALAFSALAAAPAGASKRCRSCRSLTRAVPANGPPAGQRAASPVVPVGKRLLPNRDDCATARADGPMVLVWRRHASLDCADNDPLVAKGATFPRTSTPQGPELARTHRLTRSLTECWRLAQFPLACAARQQRSHRSHHERTWPRPVPRCRRRRWRRWVIKGSAPRLCADWRSAHGCCT